MEIQKRLMLLLLFFATAEVFTLSWSNSMAIACNYYASPTGSGNGLSRLSPFKISNFWSVAKPGTTLCLIDGTYIGGSSMITPPQGLNGTASQKITIKSLNDGGAQIDGSYVRIPVAISNSNYFVLEGFNACCSKSHVFDIGSNANNHIFRRIVAWDASSSTNSAVFSIAASAGNLLEDIAGFGAGRKVFSWYGSGGPITVRRAWGRWEKSTMTGPKQVFSIAYNSHNAIFENVIGTWDESAMEGRDVDQPYGIISMDRMDGPDFCANSKYLGSIAYTTASSVVRNWIGAIFSGQTVDCVTIKDVVVRLLSSPPQRAASLAALNSASGGPSSNHYLQKVTTMPAGNSIIGNDWQVSNRLDINNLDSTSNIWNGSGSNGARVCKRYVNGSLTTQPLWPWPMNQRIMDAMKSVGKAPVDVTQTMEQIFGTIPSECRTS
jgi:hypothetical protein